MQFVPKCCKTKAMRDKGTDFMSVVFDSVPASQKTQEICDKVVSKEHFML